MKLTDKTELKGYTYQRYIATRCECVERHDGVNHYVDRNIHYIVKGDDVYMKAGYLGKTLFNKLAYGREVYDITKGDY